MITEPLHLLIVDDEEAHVEAIRRSFDGVRKVTIDAVGTLREYRERIASRLPDIALVDLNLPDGRAIEVLSHPPEDALFPILVMTAFGNQQMVVEVMKAGALDYVVKSPEVFAAMPHSVERVLSEWALLQRHKQAEASLRESEARYRALFDQARDSILLLEPVPGGEDAVIRDLNVASSSMHGYTRDELLGKSLCFLNTNNSIESSIIERIKRAHLAEDTIFECQHRRKDGSAFDVESSTVRMKIEGKPFVLDISRDITERKRAEAALRAGLEELRTLAEAMPQIVWITRADGWNLYFNQQWMDYTGLGFEESLGHGWNKPFHPDDRQKAWDTWQKATSGKGNYSLESRLRRADGVYRWWLLRAVPIVDTAGKVLKWYGTCTDIHDLKMAEQEREEIRTQLQQSQKMEAVGVLAGGVAHDFNNILTVIGAYAEFIHDELRPEDPMRADARGIITAASLAAALTRQLLAFSRRQVLSPRAVDLNKIVTDMTKMLKRLLHEDIELVTNLAPASCQVMVDPGQIEQVIMNLVVNARDAMPEGGTISLETVVLDGTAVFAEHPELPGPTVCLRVRDNGCGMSDEVKCHIFEPFYTTKEQGKGTGLGLSTVFGIVKQSNGEVSVESETGKGTIFSVRLALLKDVGPSSERPKSTLAGGKRSETVLLVEDDEMLRSLGERLLKHNGYTVITAFGGKNALEVMERHGKPVELLLSDVIMPGMSGRDLARELERRKLIGRTLYMSGYTDDAIVKHGVLEPGIAFINKPFTAEALALKLREVLEGPADEAKA